MERREFLKTVAITTAGTVIIGSAWNRFERRRRGVPYEEEEEEVKEGLKKIFTYYLETCTDKTLLDEKNPLSIDKDKNLEYIYQTCVRYLGLYNNHMRKTSADDILGDKNNYTKFKDDYSTNCVLLNGIIDKFNFCIEIQKILKNKLIQQHGVDPQTLDHFVDGRLGPRTLSYIPALIRHKIDIEIATNYPEPRDLKSIIDQVNETELAILPAKFSVEEKKGYLLFAKNFPIGDDLRKNRDQEIKEIIDEAISFINNKKKELSQNSTMPEAEKIKRARFLILSLINYLIDQWENSENSETEETMKILLGIKYISYLKEDKIYDKQLTDEEIKRIDIKILDDLARDDYPFKKMERADCAWYVFLIIKKLFPDLPENGALKGGINKQFEGYKRYLNGSKKENGQKFIPQDNNIYIVFQSYQRQGLGHMQIIYPNISAGIYYLTETNQLSRNNYKKINIPMIKPSVDENSSVNSLLNITTDAAVHYWLYS